MTNNEVAAKGILALIELDLDELDRGGNHLMLLFNHEETGPLVPLNWVKKSHPEWIDDWEKFMYGQAFLEHGFFVCDVQRFLTTRLKK